MNLTTRLKTPASLLIGLTVSASLLVTTPALAQIDELAPVALDDSPAAQLALDEARTQAADNPERTAELAAELLDQYSERVVVRDDDPELFESVRSSVIRLLESDPGVLAAWRRAESTAARTMLLEEGILATHQRRPLTAAGLEAGLRLAQRTIESGRPTAGLRLLDSLADWQGGAEEAARINLLRTLGLIDLARRPGADASTAVERDKAIELVAADSPSQAEALLSLRDDLAQAPDSGSRVDFETLERLDWTPLWDVMMGDALFRRKTTNMATGRILSPTSRKRAFEGGSYLVSVPAVHEDLVLVNEGYLLEALDRYTGRLVWYRDHGLSRGITPSGLPGDPNQIVLADGEAYTILGHFFPNGRGGDGVVIRFDPLTGIDRWRIRPDRMDDDSQLEGSQSAGPPLVVGDLLAIPLRKSTSRLETIDMVLAVDRADGSFKWLRTIASSGKVRSNTGRPLATLGEIDGDVLVSSAAGAIARLDGRTGSIRWLRRDEVPLRMTFSSGFAWQISGPVVCGQGVAIIDAARRHWLILDPETGEELVRRPIGAGSIAGAATWLMALSDGETEGGLLLAIGSSDVVAIDPANPDRRKWSLRQRFKDVGLPFGTQLAAGIRGRIFPIEDGIVVPVVDRLYLVDTATGTPRRLVDMPGPSNPIVTRDAIYACGSESVFASMPIEQAISALEARILAAPDAIPQALALMELSERIGRRELLVFAARAAVEASLRRSEARWNQEVLDRILEVLGRTGPDDGAVLLELAGSVAGDPKGRAKLELVRGDWLAGLGRRMEASAAWMAILEDEDVGSIRVPINDELEGAASIAALSRLRTLIQENKELQVELNRQGGMLVQNAIRDRASAAELVKLARKYGGTDAAISAGTRAVEILRDEGRPRIAAFVATVISRDFEAGHPGRQELLSLAIDSVEELDRFDLATPMLRMSLSGASGSDSKFSASRRPVLDAAPDRIQILAGIPVPVAPEIEAALPTDGIAMIENSSLVWRDSDDLQAIWTNPLESRDAEIIGFEPHLLVWEGGDLREPRLSAIDRQGGETIWSTSRISELLPPSDRLEVNTDGFLPDGSPFIPHQVIPIKTVDGILLVRRDGAVSLVDGGDGRSVRWSGDDLMGRIYQAELAGGMLHLSGSEIDGRGELVGVTVSLDPRTGRRLHRSVHESGEVRMAIGDDAGRLAVVTKGGVSMVDPAGSALGHGGGWTCSDPMFSYAPFAWLIEDDLVLVAEDGIARTLAADLGLERPEAWGTPLDGDRQPGRLQEIVRLGDRWLFRHASRLFLYDRFGRMVGADGIARPDLENVAIVPVSDGLLLVSRDAQRRIHRVHRLDERRGLFASGTPFDYASPGRFEDVLAIDGWLLLRKGGDTHALPMASAQKKTTVP